MLCTALFVALLVAAKTQNLSNVNYSFDEDFYESFDRKNCDNEDVWRLVTYDALNIEAPYGDSDKGTCAVHRSCASSFPIAFSGGTLEIDIYIGRDSKKGSLFIDVFDKDDLSISPFVYGRTSSGYGMGWRTISFEINKQFKGYIQFRGQSIKNDLVVIDAFRYSPNNTSTHSWEKVKRSIRFGNEDATDDVNHKSTSNENGEEVFEGSEANDGSSAVDSIILRAIGRTSDRQTESTNDSNNETQSNTTPFWNIFTMILITLGIVLVLSITAFSAYHCGKIRAADKLKPSLSIDTLQPPSTITIPRVTGINI